MVIVHGLCTRHSMEWTNARCFIVLHQADPVLSKHEAPYPRSIFGSGRLGRLRDPKGGI